MQASHWLAVALGGATGAILRAAVYEVFTLSRNAHLHYLPTLTVNIVGSAVMGVCWYLLVEKALLPAEWRIFIMTGLLGALTTFSTFSLDVVRLFQSDQPVEAIGYITASVLLCVLGTWLGYAGIKVVL